MGRRFSCRAVSVMPVRLVLPSPRVCIPTHNAYLDLDYSSSFHPITNRKHHCRLCGRIICSLPVKHPQRPQTCSLLFVADPQTGAVEEVGEGVDYGVRRRTMSQAGASGSGGARKREEAVLGLGDDEKFLKGVRICRDCRPVLL